MTKTIMIKQFTSKVKVQGLFVVPILVLIIGLLIPQLHWTISIGLSLIMFLIKVVKLPRLRVTDTALEVSYPFLPYRSSIDHYLESLQKVVYVDRKKAVRGSYPHSHINIYYKDKESYQVQIKIILSKRELDAFKEVLKSSQIDFEYSTKVGDVSLE